MARGKLGQTGFRQWLRDSAYTIQQVKLNIPCWHLAVTAEHEAQRTCVGIEPVVLKFMAA